MPNSPHRPFVPKRTPAERPGSASESEFRIAPPFVHGRARGQAGTAPGAESNPVSSIADFLAMDTPAASITDFLAPEPSTPREESVVENAPPWGAPPSIGDFVHAEPPFDYGAAAAAETSYELPPIEHFTDAIAEESPTAYEYAAPAEDPFFELPLPAPSDEYGWEETDWQRYDWRSAAALGDVGDPAANTAWAQTDWENPASAKDVRESAAQAIADALDGIARRIREGDLVIPQPPAAVPDPATIAATLAALLGVRR